MTPKPKDFTDGKIIDHETQQEMDYADYLADEEYNKNPSTLIQYPEDEQEQADIAYHDEVGKNTSDHGRGPIGKQVR